ncbi:Phosphoglycolate phosphatase [Sporotomaculum syntrophicum]|uniref:Phosphoglycolate phosphatase n=1 Tax=Sporotomaculum syntrophicum TaxID=182264 RepID=A0A9D2WP26_9FIRM|nr:HAD family hydrolase [Sporotomaculum syntrophicum]KAF1084468.1 Phosphoglycolate phosphatase [Sporotomaculum syntrophicum]
MPLLMAGDRKFDCDAILLDKDGTLLDFKTMWLEWCRYVIGGIMTAIPYAIEQVILEQAMGIDLTSWHVDPHGALAGGTLSGLRKSLVHVLREYGMGETQAHSLITEVYKASETAVNWEALTKPLPGLQGLLARLRANNFKLAVVSADDTERVKLSLFSLELVNYFDVIIGGDLVANSKPAPDMALLVCRLLNVEPGRAVVIGDSPRDILMAKNAGAGGIGVLSGVCLREQLDAAGADVVVEAVTELR